MSPMRVVAPSRSPVGDAGDWLPALRRYMAFAVAAHVVWEFAHLPLYTIWQTGSRSEIAVSALHCTGGDALIALSSIMLALFLVGSGGWPARGWGRVVPLTVLFGVLYTAFSEWLNVEIRGAWAYRDLMPLVPVLGIGVSPLPQWVAIPLAAFWWARRPIATAERYEVEG
jgi:hypothetical protein